MRLFGETAELHASRPGAIAQVSLSSQSLIEQVNYLAGHKSMAMTKRYDHANEERYGGAIEALDEAGKTGTAEALAAARWGGQTE